MRNARFWVYINGGPVKLTLRPGQRLSWHRAWSHDEGWSSESHTWEYEDHFVIEYIENDGTDCDGRLTQVSSWLCNVELLKSGHKPFCDEWLTAEEREFYVDVVYPQWERVSASQRDEFAEAMGY